MPAARTKADLLAVTEKEFTKLSGLLDTVPEEMALRKDDDDISIRDVIAHRAHWIDLFLGWWSDGQAGREVHFPAPGYKWSELKRYNADLRARQAHLGWEEARTLLQERHAALHRFMEERTEADLYGGPMKGAKNEWTTGRWTEAAGPSHYRSAAKYVRARLRSEGPG